MIKRSYIIYLISIVALVAIVGSGFALFFFGEQSKSEDQGKIDMSVAENPQLGTLVVNDPDDVSYAIFFDSNSVYLYRSDNITQSTPFELSVTVNQTEVQDGYKLALMCYIEVSDTDDRGVKYNPGIYSDSIVDYLAPSALKFSEGGVPFSIYDESDTAKSQIYACTIDSDVISTLTESGNSATATELTGKYNFSLELMYKNKSLAENATNYITEAKKNSKVKILFELVLVESSS